MSPRFRLRLWLPLGAAGTALVAAFALLAMICWGRARLETIPASFMVTDRHGAFLAQIGGSDQDGYGYWPPPAASERVVQAILALEDRRFWSDPEIDPLAMLRALGQDVFAGHRISGASSIAMQVARLQNPEPRTLLNKLVESGTALLLVARYGHQAILDQYLRIVPFGNNSHGIAYAARYYFDKPASDLSWAEIALLAALPQAPSRMNPANPVGRTLAVARGQRMLTYLHEQGVIGDGDFLLARDQLADIAIAPRPTRPTVAEHAILRLSRMLGGADAWLADHQEARVTSTLDLGVQRQVEQLADVRLASWRPDGAEQVAVAVVDRRSREVLAWIGSAGYFDGGHGAIDYGDIFRSPGSTLKPFLYALALDDGAISLDRPIRDSPETAPGIDNADHLYLGSLLPAQALANSRNAPAAALVRKVGIDDAYNFLGTLGIHDNAYPARHYGLGMAIGSLPTSLDRLVTAYGALANDGQLSELRWYLGEPRSAPRPVMSEASARAITLALADPMARLPSFARMGPAEFPFPVAVKTGTSQDYRDAWTMAYSDRYIVGVWVGRADDRPMSEVAGISNAGELAHDVMMMLNPVAQAGDSSAKGDFPPPPGYHQEEVCAGQRPDPCGTQYLVWVPPQQPQQAADHVLVDRRTGDLATQATPAEDVIDRGTPVASDLDRTLLQRSPMPRTPEPTLQIVSPIANARFVRNPDEPADADAIALKAHMRGGRSRLDWLVDGHLFGSTESDSSISWPLQPGSHTIEARGTNGDPMAVVHITVE